MGIRGGEGGGEVGGGGGGVRERMGTQANMGEKIKAKEVTHDSYTKDKSEYTMGARFIHRHAREMVEVADERKDRGIKHASQRNNKRKMNGVTHKITMKTKRVEWVG